VLMICQGSQSIQFIRELFSIGFTPKQLKVITIKEMRNLSFESFLDYYEIQRKYVTHDTVKEILITELQNRYELVISFSNPFIIHEDIIEKSTFINFHPGYLPNYRGSLSTIHSLINGEKFVGGSWHYLTKDVDKGNILKRFKIRIEEADTAFSLNHRIFSKGIMLIREVLIKVRMGNEGITQDRKAGRFYTNKFPSLEFISDEKLVQRINFFPPHFN
ncbi:MAG: formyltransferase family protein, partial [Bacteroidia bacterium]|nr:formyltransferase family protein [Bacteroidia bacterium]